MIKEIQNTNKYRPLKMYYSKIGYWHRKDGPALEYANGNKYWLKDGYRHRLDGPSVEYKNGYKSWNIERINSASNSASNSVHYTKEEFNSWILRIQKLHE